MVEYTKQPVYLRGAFLTTVPINITASAAVGGFTEGTTSCADCIRGTAATITSVWCSAAWNYSYTLLPITEAYPNAHSGTYAFSLTGGAATTTAATGDLGGCCNASSVVAAYIVIVTGAGT